MLHNENFGQNSGYNGAFVAAATAMYLQAFAYGRENRYGYPTVKAMANPGSTGAGTNNSGAGRGAASGSGAAGNTGGSGTGSGGYDERDRESDTTTNNYAGSGVEHGTTPSGADAGTGRADALNGGNLEDADSGTGRSTGNVTRNDIDTDTGAPGGTPSGSRGPIGRDAEEIAGGAGTSTYRQPADDTDDDFISTGSGAAFDRTDPIGSLHDDAEDDDDDDLDEEQDDDDDTSYTSRRGGSSYSSDDNDDLGLGSGPSDRG